MPEQIPKSQCETLLSFFQSGGSLTVLEALQEPFRCYALSQRCGELRRAGFNIQGEWIELPSGKRVKQYSLVACVGKESDDCRGVTVGAEGAPAGLEILKGKGD